MKSFKAQCQLMEEVFSEGEKAEDGTLVPW